MINGLDPRRPSVDICSCDHGVIADLRTLENVCWKLKTKISAQQPCLDNQRLKTLQQPLPEASTVVISVSRLVCPDCGAVLEPKLFKDRSHIHYAFAKTTIEHRFKVHSLATGVQYASYRRSCVPGVPNVF